MSSEQIFTSNFARVGNAKGAIAICRRPPRWYRGEVNLDFAPSAKMLSEVRAGGSWDEFTENYVDILVKQDAVAWVSELLERDDHPLYLLCFEGAGVPNSCHRQTFSQYVQELSGFWIPEFEGNLTTNRPHRTEAAKPTKIGDVVTDTTGQKWILGEGGELVRQTEMFNLDELMPPAGDTSTTENH
jgi:hypothetical protein